jgi:hypothetical protein
MTENQPPPPFGQQALCLQTLSLQARLAEDLLRSERDDISVETRHER